jgi:hypothetical protein
MNQSLKSKRDELAAREYPLLTGQNWHQSEVDMQKEAYVAGFNDAIQAVIELLGEFDEDKSRSAGGFGTAYPYDFVDGAKFQHEQMLKKLRGES